MQNKHENLEDNQNNLIEKEKVKMEGKLKMLY